LYSDFEYLEQILPDGVKRRPRGNISNYTNVSKGLVEGEERRNGRKWRRCCMIGFAYDGQLEVLFGEDGSDESVKKYF